MCDERAPPCGMNRYHHSVRDFAPRNVGVCSLVPSLFLSVDNVPSLMVAYLLKFYVHGVRLFRAGVWYYDRNLSPTPKFSSIIIYSSYPLQKSCLTMRLNAQHRALLQVDHSFRVVLILIAAMFVSPPSPFLQGVRCESSSPSVGVTSKRLPSLSPEEHSTVRHYLRSLLRSSRLSSRGSRTLLTPSKRASVTLPYVEYNSSAVPFSNPYSRRNAYFRAMFSLALYPNNSVLYPYTNFDTHIAIQSSLDYSTESSITPETYRYLKEFNSYAHPIGGAYLPRDLIDGQPPTSVVYTAVAKPTVICSGSTLSKCIAERRDLKTCTKTYDMFSGVSCDSCSQCVQGTVWCKLVFSIASIPVVLSIPKDGVTMKFVRWLSSGLVFCPVGAAPSGPHDTMTTEGAPLLNLILWLKQAPPGIRYKIWAAVAILVWASLALLVTTVYFLSKCLKCCFRPLSLSYRCCRRVVRFPNRPRFCRRRRRSPSLSKTLLLAALAPAAKASIMSVSVPMQVGALTNVSVDGFDTALEIFGRVDRYSYVSLTRGVDCHVQASYRACCYWNCDDDYYCPQNNRTTRGFQQPMCAVTGWGYAGSSSDYFHPCISVPADNKRLYTFNIQRTSTDSIQQYRVVYRGTSVTFSFLGCVLVVDSSGIVAVRNDSVSGTEICSSLFARTPQTLSVPLLPLGQSLVLYNTTIRDRSSWNFGNMVPGRFEIGPFHCVDDPVLGVVRSYAQVAEELIALERSISSDTIAQYAAYGQYFSPIYTSMPGGCQDVVTGELLSFINCQGGFVSITLNADLAQLLDVSSAALAGVQVRIAECNHDDPNIRADVTMDVSSKGKIKIFCPEGQCLSHVMFARPGIIHYNLSLANSPTITFSVNGLQQIVDPKCKASKGGGGGGHLDPLVPHHPHTSSSSLWAWLIFGVVAVLIAMIAPPIITLILRFQRNAVVALKRD